MAEHVIKLPDVGEGVAEAELVEWTVKVGDVVREDDILAAVMTDKATVEIPSPVEGAFRTLDPRLLSVAGTLGASPTRVFLRVALPMTLPGVMSGAALAWARALGEFGATITFAGNFSGRTQTAPLAVYVALQADPDAAIALSLVMLALSIAVLGLLRGRWLS